MYSVSNADSNERIVSSTTTSSGRDVNGMYVWVEIIRSFQILFESHASMRSSIGIDMVTETV